MNTNKQLVCQDLGGEIRVCIAIHSQRKHINLKHKKHIHTRNVSRIQACLVHGGGEVNVTEDVIIFSLTNKNPWGYLALCVAHVYVLLGVR